MGRVYISVSEEEFKRQLKRADANGMREQLLEDAIAANAAVLANTSNPLENLAKSESKVALSLSDVLKNDALIGRKFEKAVVAALYSK